MLDFRLTHHAEMRMRQRSFRKADVDLVLSVATRVADDAFFLTDRDAVREIERRKHEIQQLERLRGSKIIVEGGALVTLYHDVTATRQHEKEEAAMTMEISKRTMLVALPESVVGALLQINASLNAGLADSLQSLIAGSTSEAAKPDHQPSEKARSMLQAGKYSAEFLGTRLVAWTLPEIFAQVVDLTAVVAPEALDKLAAMRATKRRFVARNREAIHPGRRDLAVMQTASGWWISENIGQEDLKRALRALAQAAGLSFDEDIKFPSPLGPR